MQNEPLVSIIVVTYKSKYTVIETLDSIRNQDYQNIELIISDDCSPDNTVEICNDWLDKFRDRFVSSQIVTTEKNTGVCGNLNRGVNASKGLWIKTIAGDDILEPNAITCFVETARSGNYNLLCARMKTFPESEAATRVQLFLDNNQFYWLNKQGENLYRRSLIQHILPGPGIFYSRALYDRIGGFDENYQQTEEWTFQIKAFKVARFHYIDKCLVKYRVSGQSLSTTSYAFGKDPWLLVDRLFFLNERKRLMLKEHLYLQVWHETLTYYCIDKGSKGKGTWIKLLMLFSPLVWFRKIGLYNH